MALSEEPEKARADDLRVCTAWGQGSRGRPGLLRARRPRVAVVRPRLPRREGAAPCRVWRGPLEPHLLFMACILLLLPAVGSRWRGCDGR